MADIYFDNAATTQVDARVVAAMQDVMQRCYGNPSSLHRKGLEAERVLKHARSVLAQALHGAPEEILFTGSGSEANNLAIIGSCLAMRGKGGIITTKIEHPCVLACMKYLEQSGWTVRYLDVDETGVVRLGQLAEAVDAQTRLVSIMHVNNECGSIQPMREIYQTVKRANPSALVHTDHVQGFCKTELPPGCADLIAVSGHKIHGPKGVGALYVKKGVRLSPVIFGGGQERGLRGGTENMPGIAGLAKAVEVWEPRLEQVRAVHGFIAQHAAEVPEVYVNGGADGSPYILNLAVMGLRSEILLHSLEQYGIFVSSGSACSSHKPQPSHVLTAMGLPRGRVDSSIRLSFCNTNTPAEAEAFCRALAEIAEKNKKIRRLKS